MSSTAPLQAFTESALKSQKARDRAAKSKDSRGGRGAGGGHSGRSGGGSRDRSSASSSGRPLKKHRPNRKLPALEFDDVARADYLTGFRKRKNARKEAAREFLEKKAKEEAKSTRKEAREARAKQAQENVKAERVALGLGEDEEDMDGKDGNEDDDMRDEDATPPPPQEYETDQHFTTVLVEEWDPDADAAPAARKHTAIGSTSRAPRTSASDKDKLIGLPASSARAMKREKAEKAKADAAAAKRVPKPAGGRSTTSAQPALPSTKAITDLLGVSTDNIEAPTATGGRVNAGPRPRAEMASARKAGKFRYESKLERAKAKAHISEIRQKRAEKRKQENADKKGKDGRRIKSGKAGRGLFRPASKKKS